jgi:simple sugar transport system substrate-binding protein/ribose transport system substrate-binding protein
LHKNAKTGAPGHINLVTIDGSKGSLQALRNGNVDAVVSQPADAYAKYALQYLRDAIAGKAITPGPTDHNSKIVPFKGSLEDALMAPLVTKANVNDATLWGNAS